MMVMDISTIHILEDQATDGRLQALYTVSALLTQAETDGRNLHTLLPRAFQIVAQAIAAGQNQAKAIVDGSVILVNNHYQVEHIWHIGESPARENTLDNTPSFLTSVVEQGLAGWVIRHQQAVIVEDTRSDARWLPRQTNHPTTQEAWSVVCAPFIMRDQAIGAVTLRQRGARCFGRDELDLLTAVANQATAAIETARLLEESRRQLRISALLNEASRTINSSLDLNEVMQSMLVQMNEFLNAEAISIALVDKQNNELVYQVAEGIGSQEIVGLRLPSNQGLSGWVMEHDQPVHVPDTSQDLRFKPMGDKRTGYHTRAMICAPMAYKGEVLGTIQAINPIDGVFTDQDLELLVNLAAIASSAIANAQQFARTQAAEARYTGLFQDSIDPIILSDLSGRIIEANRRAFAFMGYSREELLTRHISDLHAPGTKLPQVKRMQSHSVRVLNSQIITKNGRRIHVEVYAKRIAYGNAELVQWIHHDISKQIELEEMRKDLQAMLFHDLQSPLGNVISSLELLTYELPSDSSPALLEMVEIAMRSSSRLQTLIRSLLDINQLEAGHPITEQKRVNVGELLEDVWEVVRPGYERRQIPLCRYITEDLPDIYVQEDMIRRVLVNLLDNAIKYSPDSQEINIHVSRQNGRMVLLSVSDQGEGIPESLREVIFEKFRRIKTDTYSKGLGLGLAFCRLAVEAHGGRIWVDDAPKGGSRFNFTLPVWTEEKIRQ
jgi:two-component system, NtrC family, sensor histidine kinase KinB